MLGWGLGLAVLVLAYGCENPVLVADLGMKADLAGRKWVSAACRAVYSVLAAGYTLMHRREPPEIPNRLARFQWNYNSRDAESLAKINVVFDNLVNMQSHSVTFPEFKEQFEEMRSHVLGDDFKDWHDLGFQGKNPETDFRGAGSLGLLLFHSFCTKYTPQCRTLVLESHSSTSQTENGPWYPLALVSIRLSMTLCELLKRQKVLVYGMCRANPENWRGVLEQLHADLLVAFHNEWLDAVRNGEVKTYFDSEFVLKRVEGKLPQNVYKLVVSQCGNK